MHRALAQDDILRPIVDHVGSISNWPGWYLPLVLVNRAFSEHALDRLWEEPSLWHLALCMPEEYWHVVEERTRGGKLVEVEDVLDEDIQRFVLMANVSSRAQLFCSTSPHK
jgi:hypothetical protein